MTKHSLETNLIYPALSLLLSVISLLSVDYYSGINP